MGSNKQCCVVVSPNRLKREECELPKHDSLFSGWKVLIEPSDWEDYSLGKEGAEKYRVHNLPNCSLCSGIYELGIYVPCARSRRKTSKLDPDNIIPVYLGQADNVRTRLQFYGREGAHLEHGKSAGERNGSGPGLFTDIFLRGCSILYRWAPMENKQDAETAEAQLLGKFDYAWNKGSNGVRRRNDIVQKLDGRTLQQKKVVIKIDACKPLLLEDGSRIFTNQESNDLLSRILKIGTSQPRLVSLRFGFNEDHASICGVALAHGYVCRRPPVKDRKRCAEHKGIKVNGFTSKFITEGESILDDDVSAESGYQAPSFSYNMVKPQLVSNNCPISRDAFLICGITLDDGTQCRRQPVQGRKRCEEHKGRKIKGSLSNSVTEGKEHYIHGPVLESSTCANDYDQVSSETHKPHKQHSSVFLERPVINKKLDTICGVELENETFCTRQPVIGRKRCNEHKGMRVNGSKSKLPVAEIPSVFNGSGIGSFGGGRYDNSSFQSVLYTRRSAVNEEFSSICGATLANGSSCRRPPSEGRKRCWQHTGMGANSGSSFNFASEYDNRGISSDICGAALWNGSICHRMPVHGRKRCNEHKGMRVNGSKSKLPVAEIPSVFNGSEIGTFGGRKYDNSSFQSVSYSHRSVVKEEFSSICGATLVNGSSCRRPPSEGRKRCWQHTGMRANSGNSFNLTSQYDNRGISSDICGAALRNGSICHRMPVHGRKRCEQHKGMRTAF